MNLQQKDKKYLGRDPFVVPIEFTKSEGSYLTDSKNKKYIDFLAGWNVGNIGWNVNEVQNKISKFSGPNYVDPYSLYKPWVTLAETLAKVTPGKLTKSFRATGGTEAVEIAIQTAMAHTKKQKFVAIEGGYHGHSIGAMSLVKMQSFNFLDSYLIKPPFDAQAGKEVEKILSKGDVAAYISEPIICNLGVVSPTQDYFDIVQKACKKYGTVFIIDEVATGFGRTGKLFASEHYGLAPDIMCLGKGVTGGYGALGATIMTEELAKSMEFEFSFYSTFGWHPLNTAAAQANLDYLLKRKTSILTNVNKLSRYFENRLQQMKFKHHATIRVKGLAIGVEFNEKDYAAKVGVNCLKNGLIISTLGPYCFTIFPALTIDQKTAERGLDLLEKSL